MTTTNTQPTEEHARVQGLINQVSTRMGTDTTFKSAYAADPKAALLGAGLPEGVVPEVIGLFAKAEGKDDVSGYDYNDSSGYYIIDSHTTQY
jgi:hypothetical protein